MGDNLSDNCTVLENLVKSSNFLLCTQWNYPVYYSSYKNDNMNFFIILILFRGI